MGYPSYLEDIVERFNSNLTSISAATSPQAPGRYGQAPQQQRFEVERLVKNCQGLLSELMDLATNPDIKLADEVRHVRAENEELKKTIERGRGVIKELRHGYETCGRVLEQKKVQIAELNEEIEFLKNPGKVYDASFL